MIRDLTENILYDAIFIATSSDKGLCILTAHFIAINAAVGLSVQHNTRAFDAVSRVK